MLRSFLNGIKGNHPCVVSWIYMRIILLVIFCKKDFNFDWPTIDFNIFWDIEGYSPRAMIPIAILI